MGARREMWKNIPEIQRKVGLKRVDEQKKVISYFLSELQSQVIEQIADEQKSHHHFFESCRGPEPKLHRGPEILSAGLHATKN